MRTLASRALSLVLALGLVFQSVPPAAAQVVTRTGSGAQAPVSGVGGAGSRTGTLGQTAPNAVVLSVPTLGVSALSPVPAAIPTNRAAAYAVAAAASPLASPSAHAAVAQPQALAAPPAAAASPMQSRAVSRGVIAAPSALAAPTPEAAVKAPGRETLRSTAVELSKKGADAGRALDKLYHGSVSQGDVAVQGAESDRRTRLALLQVPAGPRTASLILPGGRSAAVELAVSQEELARGMSGRERVPQDGLLFVLQTNGRHEYIQKNMLIAVDYVFIDAAGKVASVAADVPASPPGTSWRRVPLVEGTPAHSFALVLPAGRAAEFGLAQGSEVGGLGPVGELVAALEPEAISKLITSEDPSAPRRFYTALKERAGAIDAFYDSVDWAKGVLKGLPGSSAAAARMRANLQGVAERAALGRTQTDHAVSGLIANAFPDLWREAVGGGSLFQLLVNLVAAPLRAYLWVQVFLHELGHWVTGWLLGGKPVALRVWSSGGGVTRFESLPESTWKRVAISLGGPAAEAVSVLAFLAAGTALWTWAMPATSYLFEQGGLAAAANSPIGWLWAAGAFLTLASLQALINMPRGWAFDLRDAASYLGFKRLAAELEWRRERMADKDAPARYYPRMLLQLLLPSFMDRQSLWDAPRESSRGRS